MSRYESDLPLVSRMKFICSKLSNLSARVSGVSGGGPSRCRFGPRLQWVVSAGRRSRRHVTSRTQSRSGSGAGGRGRGGGCWGFCGGGGDYASLVFGRGEWVAEVTPTSNCRREFLNHFAIAWLLKVVDAVSFSYWESFSSSIKHSILNSSAALLQLMANTLLPAGVRKLH